MDGMPFTKTGNSGSVADLKMGLKEDNSILIISRYSCSIQINRESILYDRIIHVSSFNHPVALIYFSPNIFLKV